MTLLSFGIEDISSLENLSNTDAIDVMAGSSSFANISIHCADESLDFSAIEMPFYDTTIRQRNKVRFYRDQDVNAQNNHQKQLDPNTRSLRWINCESRNNGFVYLYLSPSVVPEETAFVEKLTWEIIKIYPLIILGIEQRPFLHWTFQT